MPQWLMDFIMGPSYMIGNLIWNTMMDMCLGLMSRTPEDFSNEAWQFVENTLYPWSLGIGLFLLNIFFMVGFFREASNLKENLTTEILVSHLIKLVIANALMLAGIEIMKEFFTVASLLSKQVLVTNMPPLTTNDVDGGSFLFFAIFGSLYIIVAIVCGFVILLTLYGRYIKLYLMVVLAPLAMSTLAGGRGMEQSAYAWVKTFIGNVFEILVIAIVLAISGKLINSINFTFQSAPSYMNGFDQALQSMLTMILLAAAVKGADIMLRKSFAL